MASNSLVTEQAVADLANAINANKAGKSELTRIAAKVDSMPALVVVSDPALIPAGTVGLVIP